METFEKHLEQQLNALPRERQPDKDLWQGIDLAIQARSDAPQTKRQPVWLASAAVLMVAVIIGFMMQPFSSAPETDPLTGQSLVKALSQQHEKEKSALLVSLEDTPAVTGNWQEQLTELEDAAEAIKAALQEDPNNTALLRMLQSVYQQQFLLIERVHAPKWQQI
ncbi:hypothetical protein HHX48_11565 [Salinimonas sp. HHU 13199]|uniref:Anti-sigma factor n=1 Tax=Salinimonas profundi TaxID=2729140 RepID=A0ABR8LPP7_9ALTE|nr:hypothetical protein [Salinimonas profundi]MBD3586377.1 hypothetical protein [Salinimonas profundi]